MFFQALLPISVAVGLFSVLMCMVYALKPDKGFEAESTMYAVKMSMLAFAAAVLSLLFTAHHSFVDGQVSFWQFAAFALATIVAYEIMTRGPQLHKVFMAKGALYALSLGTGFML